MLRALRPTVRACVHVRAARRWQQQQQQHQQQHQHQQLQRRHHQHGPGTPEAQWAAAQTAAHAAHLRVLRALAAGEAVEAVEAVEGGLAPDRRTLRERVLLQDAEQRTTLDTPPTEIERWIEGVEIGGDRVRFDFGFADAERKDTVSLAVHALWLRDACQCAACVTPASGQKEHETQQHAAVPAVEGVAGVDAAGALVLEAAPGSREAAADKVSRIKVAWAPSAVDAEGHVSEYGAAWLARQLGGLGTPHDVPLPPRTPWDRAAMEARHKPVAYGAWMQQDSAEFVRGLTALHELGLVVVDGVPDDEFAVKRIAEQIGHVQPTFYGELFDVVSKPPAEAENVAYTNVHLGLHQDLMYMNDPPRIQLLHCLRNNVDGGESIFSDSLRAALAMQLQHPFYARALAQLDVPYHYERNGFFYFNERPVIEAAGGPGQRNGPRMSVAGLVEDEAVPRLAGEGARSGERVFATPIKHTAWSPPFQNVFAAEAQLVDAVPVAKQDDAGLDYVARFAQATTRLPYWREAAALFADAVNGPAGLYEFKLQPGQCVLFDNRRVLHGRRQFGPRQSQNDENDGIEDRPRWLKGTYVSDQVFTSRLQGMYRAQGVVARPRSPAQTVLAEQVQVLMLGVT